MSRDPVTFHYRINGGPEQTIEIGSGIYQHAALAAVIYEGVEATKETPAEVEIWVPGLGSYRYGVFQTDDGMEAGVLVIRADGSKTLVTTAK